MKMVEDKDLKKMTDYSEGQREAAYRVMGEIVNILKDFADDMRIVGGWVPTLLYENSEHLGSVDVDVLLNQQKIGKATSYENIERILLRNGYERHPDNHKFFTFVKKVIVDGVTYDVDVDFLAGKYGGNGGSFSKHVDGVKALPASGGNFAFEFPPEQVTINYTHPDGAKDVGHVNVIAVIPYLVMKSEALGRGKKKDAYDIYWMIGHYPGGVKELAKEMAPYKERELIKRMCQKFSEKFASPENIGPSDIVKFMEIEDEDEQDRIALDAYQKVDYLVRELKTEE